MDLNSAFSCMLTVGKKYIGDIKGVRTLFDLIVDLNKEA